MTTLTTDAIVAIRDWANQFNPTAGQALIDAAARSPYLASQFNQFVATGGEFAAPTANSASAETKNGITINRSYMIGTDGADSFDSSTYAQTGYFNNNLLTNFLAGGGNDEMGGAVRDDKRSATNDSTWRQVA